MVAENVLDNIRVVLVNPSHPGNIGAAARAMKNMCLRHLYLVAPQMYPHADATARATGAADLLQGAHVVGTLEEALTDCALVVGASARHRAISWPTVDPRRCAGEAVSTAASASVALLFGRENSGLTNEELERCNYLVHIPSNPGYSSLNVAAAVQVLAYELLMAVRGETGGNGEQYVLEQEFPSATAAEMAGLYEHFECALQDVDFLDPDNPRQ
ncbi:MAG: RNA methyltransferase, partial [Pseudomonadota bacterium]